MILDFPGGVAPLERTRFGKKAIKTIPSCSAICIEALEGATVKASAGSGVLIGSLLGYNGDMPIYSSISGVFRGIMQIDGKSYFVVMGDGEAKSSAPFPAEENSLSEMDCEYIAERARLLSIIDSRSGRPLHELLKKANGKCSRLVIDCTESDALSAINYRLCIEKTKSLVGGAKVLLKATGALKCVFAAEYYRKNAFDSILKLASDEKLFVTAELAEKYPYGDRAIMEALYLKTLERGKTALDEGVLIVAPETAIALYDAMLGGMPQISRYITVCGEGAKNGGNYSFPVGITLHDVSGICCISGDYLLIENSLLSGTSAVGALNDSTRALIAAKPQGRVRSACISCGKCASACPIRLSPYDILASNSRLIVKNCILCGACEFICPSGIPLTELIKNAKSSKEGKDE